MLMLFYSYVFHFPMLKYIAEHHKRDKLMFSSSQLLGCNVYLPNDVEENTGLTKYEIVNLNNTALILVRVIHLNLVTIQVNCVAISQTAII